MNDKKPKAETVVGIRMPDELKKSLQDAAKKSGWSISEQIRYELSEPRGLLEARRPLSPFKKEVSSLR